MTNVDVQSGPLIQVVAVTDPLCIWCWGAYPLIRTLEMQYGEAIQLDEWMGGMIPDIREVIQPAEGLENEPLMPALNQTLSKYWPRTVKRHGMPVKAEIFSLFDEENPSGWPICYAVNAAKLQGVLQGERMSRRVREGVFLYGEKVNRLEVLIPIAEACGLDVGAFVMSFKDGSAQRAFQNDVQSAIDFDVQVFPTWIVRNKENKVEVLRGIQTFDDLAGAINRLTDGKMQPTVPAANVSTIEQMVSRYGSVTDAELISAVNYDPAALQADVEQMVKEGKVQVEYFGEQYLLRPAVVD